MFKGFVLGIVLTIITIAVVGYVVIVTGTIPAAAANGQPLPLEQWAARTSLQATLKQAAPMGPNPVPLSDANLIAGIGVYSHHCVFCHGTAQGERSPVAQGQYPAPPQLAKDGVEADPEGWTFWTIQNGIRWTGMPSWKGTLTEQQIWQLALFLKHMDKLPPAPQQAWQQLKR
jgi:thiosulfate dehydrogenase